jgi:hypothetical protein
MKRIIISAVALCGLAAFSACGGGSSDGDICDDGIDATCSKFDACGIQDRAECETELAGSCDENFGCDPGETFNAGPAEDCIDQIDAADCADILDGSADLSACDQVCS